MALPSLNRPCPCGSGKLYKRCHGSKSSPDPFLGVPDNIVAHYRDRQTGERRVFLSDLVWTLLHDESSQAGSAFDARFKADIDEISHEAAVAHALLRIGLENAEGAPDADLLLRLGHILENALESSLGALQLTRHGFGLQPGMLLRSVVEGVSVVFDVVVNESSTKKYRRGKYSPTGSATRASSVFKFLGRFFGTLSESHTHIKAGHEQYRARSAVDDTAAANLSLVKVGVALVGLAAEFLFQRSAAQPRYWKRHRDGSLQFAPDTDTRHFLREFPKLKRAGTQG